MLDSLLGALSWLHGYSDPLAGLVVAAFLGGALLEPVDRDRSRYVLVGAWTLFALFWLSLVYHFGPEQKSYVEGVGSALAVPASLAVAHALSRGRDSLFVLSRGVAAMGLIFVPFETVPWLRAWLVETVTRQTEFVMSLLGQEPRVVSGATVAGESYPDYRNTFYFDHEGHAVTYTIVVACTGVGSMAIVGGIVTAIRAPLGRKLRALAVSIPVVWVLNVARNAFIGLSFGQQRMQFLPDLTLWLFGATDPYKVSYFWADRIVAQSLSVVALVAIIWLVVRELPEVLPVVEDLLYLATGNEYDLGARDRVRAGGGRAD